MANRSEASRLAAVAPVFDDHRRGWFGFNAGSALAADAVASNAFLTTMTASAAAVMSWPAQSVAAVVAAPAFAFLGTLLIAWLVKRLVGFRVGAEVEAGGIDEAEHADRVRVLPAHASASSIMGTRPSPIAAAPEESAR